MNILFCVEFYHPSIGGAQTVVRELAERLAARGHEVAVATTRLAGRTSSVHAGVAIHEFGVAGNLARGLSGEVDAYRSFLTSHPCDVVFFYAAQQWTFDAAWDVLDRIGARKVLVPCGYSGLFDPAYRDYFERLPGVLGRMDAAVYHALSYRDIEFAEARGVRNGALIPNGADAEEFAVARDAGFRSRYGIAEDEAVLLTVGSLTGFKGHEELLRAFELADFGSTRATLILDGNVPSAATGLRAIAQALAPGGVVKLVRRLAGALWRTIRGRRGTAAGRIERMAGRINSVWHGNKRALVVDLERAELIQAYLNADLFVFASNVEYSPLVLFEACAAGLSFLAVPAGNAAEIVAWTGGGQLAPATVDPRGFTRADPTALARSMETLVADADRRALLAARGRQAIARRHNWASLALEYEALFLRLVGGQGLRPDPTDSSS